MSNKSNYVAGEYTRSGIDQIQEYLSKSLLIVTNYCYCCTSNKILGDFVTVFILSYDVVVDLKFIVLVGDGVHFFFVVIDTNVIVTVVKSVLDSCYDFNTRCEFCCSCYRIKFEAEVVD